MERGLTLFAIVDHNSGGAREVGLELRDTKLVIFGSPVAGTPVMVAAPLAALDLPLKVLIWNNEGHTQVSYTSVDALGRVITCHQISRLGSSLSNRSPMPW